MMPAHAAAAMALAPLFASSEELKRLHAAQDAMAEAFRAAHVARDTAALSSALAATLVSAAEEARRQMAQP